ncbi:EAL domain-containing protein [Alishewanella longhuensis]
MFTGIDDFGTGYSSLSYLYRLPADSIKLDRSFTQDLQNDAKQRKIVEMIVSTCKQMDKRKLVAHIKWVALS